jgi:hypothetical protein
MDGRRSAPIRAKVHRSKASGNRGGGAGDEPMLAQEAVRHGEGIYVHYVGRRR